jgi:hypothetical protein
MAREAVMSTVTEQAYTPEDLLAMPYSKDYELVDGHLVERHMSLLSSWVGGQLHFDWLRDDGELSGEDVLPGFRCRLTTIFPERAASKTQAARS